MELQDAIIYLNNLLIQNKRIDEIDNLSVTTKEAIKTILEKSISKERLQQLRERIAKECDCAKEGFMKKQIPTSVVDGTIVQELGWILDELDKIINSNK